MGSLLLYGAAELLLTAFLRNGGLSDEDKDRTAVEDSQVELRWGDRMPPNNNGVLIEFDL